MTTAAPTASYVRRARRHGSPSAVFGGDQADHAIVDRATPTPAR